MRVIIIISYFNSFREPSQAKCMSPIPFGGFGVRRTYVNVNASLVITFCFSSSMFSLLGCEQGEGFSR